MWWRALRAVWERARGGEGLLQRAGRAVLGWAAAPPLPVERTCGGTGVPFR